MLNEPKYLTAALTQTLQMLLYRCRRPSNLPTDNSQGLSQVQRHKGQYLRCSDIHLHDTHLPFDRLAF
jgi:hypothetical protein